jgi:hypothetical protein
MEVKPSVPCYEGYFGGKINHYLPQFLVLCYYITADRIAGELWWTIQEHLPDDIIQPWFSILMFNPGAEK